MSFKIINPNFDRRTAAARKAENHAPAVASWLLANPGNRLVSLAELRAGLPDIAGDLGRAVVNHICSILALEIEGADDAAE